MGLGFGVVKLRNHEQLRRGRSCHEFSGAAFGTAAFKGPAMQNLVVVVSYS